MFAMKKLKQKKRLEKLKQNNWNFWNAKALTFYMCWELTVTKIFLCSYTSQTLYSIRLVQKVDVNIL